MWDKKTVTKVDAFIIQIVSCCNCCDAVGASTVLISNQIKVYYISEFKFLGES